MRLPHPASLSRALAATLLCLVLAGTPAVATAGPPPAALTSGGPPVAAAPLIASPWTSLWHMIESSLNTRAGLLRLGVVGMVLGLFIIMFGNKWK